MTQTQHQPDPPVSQGTGVAFILAFIVALLLIMAIWLVLFACGIRLFGTEYRFPWCSVRSAALIQIEEAQSRNNVLRDQIHQAELALLDPALCGPPVEPAPLQIPEPPALSPEPEPEPEQQEPTEDQANLCEPNQVFQQPKEVALILDGSGSMQYSVNVPADLEQAHLRAWRAANRPPADIFAIMEMAAANQRVLELERQLQSVPGRGRMSVAKEVLRQIVQNAPDSIALDFTAFHDCNNITSRNFSQSDRASLQREIASQRPEGGTPVARAMSVAAQNLEGGDTIDDPVNMVLVTDGNDSCEGDPCAVARQLKQAKPGLIINVIDMSKSDSLLCVADITGGTYRRNRGSNLDDLTKAIAEASGYEGQGQCRPAATDQP